MTAANAGMQYEAVEEAVGTICTPGIKGQLPSQPGMSEATNAPAKIDRDTFQSLVLQALHLRPIYREIFILCDIKSYTTAEAANILGISEEAAIRRLRQARGLMQKAKAAVPLR